jgi:hypothetical protein
MNALKPMYQATRDALAAENWELACEQAQLCAAAASHHGVPGLAVRVLLMQARAAGCSGEHQLALQVSVRHERLLHCCWWHPAIIIGRLLKQSLFEQVGR